MVQSLSVLGDFTGCGKMMVAAYEGPQPDFWALNGFRRRHSLAINNCFTQVVELAGRMGLRQLGTVAIDATRIKASASPDKVARAEGAHPPQGAPLAAGLRDR